MPRRHKLSVHPTGEVKIMEKKQNQQNNQNQQNKQNQQSKQNEQSQRNN